MRSARVLAQLLPAAALGALFAAVGVIHVTSRVMVVNVGYRLSSLEQEGQGLERTNERLRLELATLKNPARLERLAREQLGMGPAPAGTVVTIKSADPARSLDPFDRLRGASARGIAVAKRVHP
jgi:cell division protein FtsL